MVSQRFGLPVPSLIPDQLMDSEFNAVSVFLGEGSTASLVSLRTGDHLEPKD